MTHAQYNVQYLETLSLNRLKQIATEIGAEPQSDKRLIQSWITAIVYRQEVLYKPEPSKVEVLGAALEAHEWIFGQDEGYEHTRQSLVEAKAAQAIDTLTEWMEEADFNPEPSPEEILEQQRFSEEVCEALALRIHDLELEYGDVVIPPGVPSWEVYDFCGVLEGCITKHPNPNRNTYHTPDGGVYDDPYTAALSLVSLADLMWAKAKVVAAREERAALPDYF